MSEPLVPLELDHAKTHLLVAIFEVKAGQPQLAAAHVREAICDSAWALEILSHRTDDRPTRSEQSLEGAAVNGLTPVGQEASSRDG